MYYYNTLGHAHQVRTRQQPFKTVSKNDITAIAPFSKTALAAPGIHPAHKFLLPCRTEPPQPQQVTGRCTVTRLDCFMGMLQCTACVDGRQPTAPLSLLDLHTGVPHHFPTACPHTQPPNPNATAGGWHTLSPPARLGMPPDEATTPAEWQRQLIFAPPSSSIHTHHPHQNITYQHP